VDREYTNPEQQAERENQLHTFQLRRGEITQWSTKAEKQYLQEKNKTLDSGTL
jgi:hypothetical protein